MSRVVPCKGKRHYTKRSGVRTIGVCQVLKGKRHYTQRSEVKTAVVC